LVLAFYALLWGVEGVFCDLNINHPLLWLAVKSITFFNNTCFSSAFYFVV